MIRLAVLSDIHGILPALQAVLADAFQYGVEGYILAGDYTAGPFQDECIRIQRALRGWAIHGNGELNLRKFDLGQAPPDWSDRLQFALLRHSYDHLDRDTLGYLAALPEQIVVQVDGLAPIRVVHGSPRSPYEEIFTTGDTRPLESALAETHEQVLVCGHTHIPWLAERTDKMAFNPGSVGGPLNGFVGAQYALLSWDGARWQVEHRAVRYDIELVRRAFLETGLIYEGGALARAFLLSIETGRNVPRAFLEHAYRLSAQAGSPQVSAVPDEIWERADAMFDWEGTHI